PRDERARVRGKEIRCGGVVEPVPLSICVPEREMDVAAVAGVLGPGLRRERRDEAVTCGNAADRLAHQELLVRRSQGRRVRSRDLVLSVSELGVVLLEAEP